MAVRLGPGGVSDTTGRRACRVRDALDPGLERGRVGFLEVESFAIDFLSAPLLAGGQRSRAAQPSRRDARTGGAAQRSRGERSALEGWPAASNLAAPGREEFSARFLGQPRLSGMGGTQRVAHQGPQRWAGHAGASRMPGISSRREGAWWAAATARRVQSLSRRRHGGGSHAVTRTRALAVPDPAHPASACSRQRNLPSRRP